MFQCFQFFIIFFSVVSFSTRVHQKHCQNEKQIPLDWMYDMFFHTWEWDIWLKELKTIQDSIFFHSKTNTLSSEGNRSFQLNSVSILHFYCNVIWRLVRASYQCITYQKKKCIMRVCQITFIVLVSKGSALNCPSTERMKEVRGALY